MTKEQIRGAVLLKITGGQPSSDNSVWIDDIDVLIAPAVNYVQLKQYYVHKQDERERIINPFMLQTFGDLPIENDESRKRKFITIPHIPISLPNGRGLEFVGDVRGRKWIPISQGLDDMQDYYSGFKRNVTSYRPEGKKIYLFNVGPLVEKAMVRMIVNVTALEDTDEIILPSDGEFDVINLIYEWITGQRAMPKDEVVDTKDKVQ